ncbi:hypothetical protein I317_07707 [Kwoniella heveanensis CBS 569]|uniref:Fructose-bisphosphate aldolase n=1 Tax=Kwoniella heveanensis BCC8398 TaxID=1296120 RepID=A0A1B9GK96_9TREE|nr:hypothetical protein I316_06838 [Kwoniella heveanensis BCC8398]OCF38526.1 hypothetical protein I317_07707 [Kwoniella heveanensis CBS 569]
MSLANNNTYRVVEHSRANGYAVPGVCVYNVEGVLAVIQAAEAKRSPVLIQFFPWAMHFYGREFIEYVVKIAHAASVPIGIHLDHCLKPEDAELALTMPFDSIMIDGSEFDEAGALEYCKSITDRARAKGMAVEVELGRMEGGEDGLPTIELEEIMTNPTEALHFVEDTKCQLLAPSFGNVHGNYGPKGPQWDKERLKRIHAAVKDNVALVLHGTHGVTDELFTESIHMGFSKININKSCRERHTEYLKEKAGRVELTVQIAEGIAVYKEEIEHYMDLFGSSGKAF